MSNVSEVLSCTHEDFTYEAVLMVSWVIGSIPHGGAIELYLVPVSAARLV